MDNFRPTNDHDVSDDGSWTVSVDDVTSGGNSGCWTVVNGVDLRSTCRLQIVDFSSMQPSSSSATGMEDNQPLKDNNHVELEDFISAETCALFRRQQPPSSSSTSMTEEDVASDVHDQSPPPSIRLEMKPESLLVISGLTALCTRAKHLELYDVCRGGEYVTSVRTHVLDLGEMQESDDHETSDDHAVVYKTSVNLVNNLQSITIKFLVPKTSDTMWLYGMFVRVRRRSRSDPIPAPIMARNSITRSIVDVASTVDELEKNGVTLSDNAKRFASLLRTGPSSSSSSSSSLTSTTLATLMASFFPREQIRHLGRPARETPDISVAADERMKGTTDVTCNYTSTSTMASTLASVLQSSLRDMEMRLSNLIEARLTLFEERQAEKLNRILELLDNKTEKNVNANLD